MHNRVHSFLVLAVFLTPSIACVQSREPPALPAQALVAYGPKIFLVDETRGGAPASGFCTRLATVATSATATVTATDGKDGAFNRAVPHNCYVNVAPKDLKVDVIEVTNELYQ